MLQNETRTTNRELVLAVRRCFFWELRRARKRSLHQCLLQAQ